MPAPNATQRFSDRVDNYIRYRPGYPAEILDLLRERCGLTPEARIADIGFGTGIFTRMLLGNGNTVFGVEPNQEMREAGERLLSEFPNFRSASGTAEKTTLEKQSVEYITAAQAAHWFDREPARQEFLRILRPGGWLVLLWNERLTQGTPFLVEYERLLLEFGTDYAEVRHERTTDVIKEFFAPSPHELATFPTQQVFDFAGLEGRVYSSSYIPGPGDPRSRPLQAALRALFDRHQVNDTVAFDYATKVFFGRLA
jgi:SAM-dependent methyltransferase